MQSSYSPAMVSEDKAKYLLEKWGKILDYTSNKVAPIEEGHKRLSTAILMENQQKYLQENSINSGVFGTGGNYTGAGSWTEDKYATGDARLPKVLIPMIRRTFPELITNEIVGVQPMSGPVGLAFALRYKYDNNALGYAGSNPQDGNVTNPSQAWWSNATEMGYQKLNTAHTGVTASQAVMDEMSAFRTGGASSADFHMLDDDMGVAQLMSQFELTSNIPQMTISLEKTSVEAGTRRLAAKWSVELEQDLKAMNGIDVDNEMTNAMSYEIQAEIDREMVIRIIRTCLKAGSARTGGGYSFWYAPSADARWLGERYRDFYARLIVEANRVAIRNRRGAANFIVATPRVCAMLEMLPEFKCYTVNGNVNTQPTGIAKVGSVGGRFNIYRDTRTEAQYSGYSTSGNLAYTGLRASPLEFALLGYKGAEYFDTGIVYCPYIPVMIQRTTGPNDFAPRVGMMTRYGVVDHILNSENFYALVIVKGLGDDVVGAYSAGAGRTYL
jgi:hypothetical protein